MKGETEKVGERPRPDKIKKKLKTNFRWQLQNENLLSETDNYVRKIDKTFNCKEKFFMCKHMKVR